jgi:hypothetical protein
VPALGADTIKVVCAGHLETAQTWSTGFYMNVVLAGGAFGPGEMNDIADKISVPAVTWLTSFINNWSQSTFFEKVTTYFIPSTGTHATFVGEKDLTTPLQGAGTTGFTPIDTAMVQSLRTVAPGRSGRGRMYVPYNVGGIDATGHFSSSNVDNAAHATATFLTAVNALNLAVDNITSQDVVVASFTKAFVTLVTHVIVDNIPDGQRRRKDKLGVSHQLSVAV